MTFDSRSSGPNRQPITVAEIVLDNPLSISGIERHCDTDNPFGEDFSSSLFKVDWNPTKITSARGLGYRGTVKVIFSDFRHGDKGTYFGKLKALNPFYLDRKIKIHTGFLDLDGSFNWSNMKEHLYFIKKIELNDKDQFIVTAKDPLTLLDRDQALAPTKTSASLSGALTDSYTGTLTISSNDGFDSVGGYAVIEDEIIKYTGVSGSTDITGVTRGILGSTAAAHSSGEEIRNCFGFENLNCVDVIRDLIEDFTDIDHANYIDDTAWNTERDTYLSAETISGIVTEPTPVKEIVKKISEQTWLDLWWSDEDQKIKLQSIGPTITEIASLNHRENILNKGHKIKENIEKAVTQIWYYYDKIDHLGSDDPNNFSSLYVKEDLNLEGSSGHGTQKIKKIFASFVPSGGAGTASKVCSRIIASSGRGDRYVDFMVDAKDSSIKTGDTISVESDLEQDANGDPVSSIYRVISKEQVSRTVYKYSAMATGQVEGATYGIIGPNTLVDYTLESQANKDNYGFITGSDGKMSNGDEGYLIL